MTKTMTIKEIFQTLQEMRNYLCEWKYDNNDKTYMEDTFDLSNLSSGIGI